MSERLIQNEGRAAGSGDLAGLLDATARGDRAAFRALYDATAAKLFGIVLRITGNRAVAEEVLQNAYVKIWQNADRFSPVAGRPMTWLCALARHTAIDHLRSERTGRQLSVDLDDEAIARLPAPTASGGADSDSLRTCLDQLGADARNCVVLAYCWGFSRDELAARFDRPVNTIKTLLHRSLKALSVCLEKE